MEVYGATSAEPEFRQHRGQRVFTLEHANRTLPLVSRVVTDIVTQYKQVCALEERCQEMDGSDSEAEALREDYARQLDELRELRNELSEIGCQLKDWRRGIVDFLAIHNGRPVELCWRLGEDKIEHWHEIDSGFRGRQMIDEDFIASIAGAKKQTT